MELVIPKLLVARGDLPPRILARPDGWEGSREAMPPQRLDIARRGGHRAAPGLKLGAYQWRRPRQGPPAVSTEFPPRARAWRGIVALFYGESAGFPVIISQWHINAGGARCHKSTSIPKAGIAGGQNLQKREYSLLGGNGEKAAGLLGRLYSARGEA